MYRLTNHIIRVIRNTTACLLVICSGFHLKSQCIQNDLLDSASSISYYDFKASVEISQKVLKTSIQTNNTMLAAAAKKQLSRTFWAHAFYDSALYYGWAARDQLKKIEYCRSSYADILGTIGLLYFYVAEYDSSSQYLEKSLNIYLDENDSSNISRVYNNLGLLYDTQGSYKKSMELLYKGMQYKVRYSSIRDQYFSKTIVKPVYEDSIIVQNFLLPKYKEYTEAADSQDAYKIASLESTIGNLHKFNNNLDSAIYYYLLAGENYSRIGVEALEALEYTDIGRCYLEKKQPSRALNFFLKAEGLLQKTYMYATLDGVQRYIAQILMDLREYDQSEKYLVKHRALVDTLPHPKSLVKNILIHSELLRRKRSYENAILLAETAYKKSIALNNYSLRLESAKLLGDLNSKVNNYENAIRYKDEWAKMNSTFQQAKYDRENLRLANALNLQTRNKEISSLSNVKKQQDYEIRLRNIYLGIALGLILIFLFFSSLFYLRYAKTKKLTEALNEKNDQLNQKNNEIEILLKEVHHRVKNNLQMISSMISMQNRHILTEQTKDQLKLTQNRVKSIGLIHEFLYKNESLNNINLKNYLDELIEVILRTFKEKAKPEIVKEIENVVLDIDSCISIGLIIHELIINSLKYAFDDLDMTTTKPAISIELSKINDEIFLSVKDNGKGNCDFIKGFGWSIIDATVKSMNGSSKVDFSRGFTAEFYLKENLSVPTYE